MSLLKNLRGFNVHYGPWKTRQRERGLTGPPNDFYAVRGDASTEQTYEQFCASLEANGCNWIRVKLVGRQDPLNSNAHSFQPPPLDTYNLWNIALDPANLTQYRANQVTLPAPSDVWAASNLGQFIVASDRHGIKWDVIPFHNEEFDDQWTYHAWNSNNRYVNGVQCLPEDRGFMSDPMAFFTNPQAIQAAKDRIDAILAAFQGYEHVIGSWEIMAEQTWLATPPKLGADGWDAVFFAGIAQMRDWNEELAQYVKSKHAAPVGVSHAFEPDVRGDNGRGELYNAPSLDWIGINAYGKDAEAAHNWLRVAQAYYPGKQIVVQQYAPWALGPSTSKTESAPYRVSKGVEWALACGSPGFIGGLRWMDIDTGTYATPELQEIAGVTTQMAAVADLDNWQVGQQWDGRVQSPDLGMVSAWGDGRYLTAFLRWTSTGAKSVAVQGMDDGEYTVRWFDYLEGDEVRVSVATAAGGVLNLGDAVMREQFGAVCVTPDGIVPPPDPPDPPDPPPDPPDDLEGRVEVLEAAVLILQAQTASLSAGVTRIGEQLDAVQSDVGQLQNRLDLIDGRLEGVEQGQVQLVSRMSQAETVLAGVLNRLETAGAALLGQ